MLQQHLLLSILHVLLDQFLLLELCVPYIPFILLFFSICMQGVSGRGTEVKRRVEVERGGDYRGGGRRAREGGP
jgi:hypothetical protein